MQQKIGNLADWVDVVLGTMQLEIGNVTDRVDGVLGIMQKMIGDFKEGTSMNVIP